MTSGNASSALSMPILSALGLRVNSKAVSSMFHPGAVAGVDEDAGGPGGVDDEGRGRGTPIGDAVPGVGDDAAAGVEEVAKPHSAAVPPEAGKGRNGSVEEPAMATARRLRGQLDTPRLRPSLKQQWCRSVGRKVGSR